MSDCRQRTGSAEDCLRRPVRHSPPVSTRLVQMLLQTAPQTAKMKKLGRFSSLQMHTCRMQQKQICILMQMVILMHTPIRDLTALSKTQRKKKARVGMRYASERLCLLTAGICMHLGHA